MDADLGNKQLGASRQPDKPALGSKCALRLQFLLHGTWRRYAAPKQSGDVRAQVGSTALVGRIPGFPY